MESLKNMSRIIIVFFIIVGFSGCDELVDKFVPEPSGQKVSAPVAVEKVKSSEAEAPLAANVLVKVGSWELTLEQFNRRIDAVKTMVQDFDDKDVQAKAMILDELVRQQLLVQEAKDQKLLDKTEIKEAITDFENTLLVQEIVKNLTKDVTVSKTEAKEYYDANPDYFINPIEKKLSEIVVSSDADAKGILVQLLQGADFSDIAKAKSLGETAAQGGDLGYVVEASTAEMQTAIGGLGKGALSSVFSGPLGYSIVKVEDIRGGDKASFEDITEDLVNALTMQKQQQAVMDKLAEVAEKVNVQSNPDLLEKIGE